MFENKTIDEKLELFKTATNVLRDNLPKNNDALDYSPGSPHWTIREIIAHLADTEGIYFIRFRKALTEPPVELLVFDQGGWAERFTYRKKKIEISLELLESLRTANYQVLATVSDLEWSDKKYQVGDEKFSFEKLLERNLNHIYGHIEIIKKRNKQFNS